MNPFFARFLSSVYRKEPISGFILIFGVTDILIGGIGGRWNLFSVGFTFALIGIGLRALQANKKAQTAQQKRRIKYQRYQLPPAASNPPLPLLVSKKRRR